MIESHGFVVPVRLESGALRRQRDRIPRWLNARGPFVDFGPWRSADVWTFEREGRS